MQIKQILIFVLLTPSAWVAAQKKTGTFELGAAIAAFTYQGDLTPEAIGSFKTMKPGFVLSASKIFSTSMALRLQLVAGSIKETKQSINNLSIAVIVHLASARLLLKFRLS
jgi:hypothetical protein